MRSPLEARGASPRETRQRGERNILPQDLLDHYAFARKDTYASQPSSDALPDLSIPGTKGFVYPPEVIESGHSLPYRYRDEWVSGKEKGAFSGREINFSRYDESDLITWYSYMGGLTEEGMRLGEDFVYEILLRAFLRRYSNRVRLGGYFQFEHQTEQGNIVYKGEGIRTGRSWHDTETIELNGARLYLGKGDGGYDPAARRRALDAQIAELRREEF